jgi:hypothetical protein
VKVHPEGPLERKFWIAVMILTFGPIALSMGAGILGWLAGDGDDGFTATAPLLLFGFVMVGLVVVGFGLASLFKGKPDWLELIIGSAWLFFFGRAFLQMLGLQGI